MTPTTYGRDFAYCLKSHGGVRGIYMSMVTFDALCPLFTNDADSFRFCIILGA